MNKSQRSSLTLGVILVVLGGIFVAANLVPSLRVLLDQANTWPMIIEAVAVGLLLLGLVIGVPDMAVPARDRWRHWRHLVVAECHRQLDQLGLHVGVDPGFLRRGHVVG